MRLPDTKCKGKQSCTVSWNEAEPVKKGMVTRSEGSTRTPTPSTVDTVSVHSHHIGAMNVPGEIVFPRRLITVLSVENSGTQLLTETLAVATGVAINISHKFQERYYDDKRDTEVIHMSQPWGWDPSTDSCGQLENVRNIFALVPEGCSHGGILSKRPTQNGNYLGEDLPKSCQRAGLREFVTYPLKFFLNITSHIKWYEERGVETVTAIIVRD